MVVVPPIKEMLVRVGLGARARRDVASAPVRDSVERKRAHAGFTRPALLEAGHRRAILLEGRLVCLPFMMFSSSIVILVYFTTRGR